MRKPINRKLILFLILLIAFTLRFYRLGDYPALNADEAAIGYNAYSLIQTGHDEHGNPWPVHFQSFNDYKPGLYFYMVLPFVKLLGMNEWAVRIPGALLGVATVLAVYLLVSELGGYELRVPGLRKLTHNALTRNGITALTASFFLAISPWHIHFSRGGWEVNVATFFIVCGVWLFLKALKNSVFLFFSFSVFSLSLYTYHAARVVVPLLGLGLLIICRREIRKNAKVFLIAAGVALILLVPLVRDFTKSGTISRATGVGLFADPGPLARINEQRGEHGNYKGLVPKILHNKVVNYSLAFLENWGQHFWGEFLFLSGDLIQRNKVPETGVMYLFDIIFLLAGFIAIAKRPKGWGIILLWLAAAPTAAALTFQSPHALRAQNVVIPLTIISAFGLIVVLGRIKVIKLKMLRVTGYALVGVLVVWSFVRYEHMYWVHMAKEYPYSSQYGVKELVSYVKENQGKYEKIIVTDRYDQPYILFLFYLKYPPEKFQKEHGLTPRDKFGFSTVRAFDKFQFQPIDFDNLRPANPRSLIIGTEQEIPKEANIVKKIDGANGYLYFEVVAN